MDANEIITKNEVVENAVEEIANADPGKGFNAVAGFGLGILAGIIAYKYMAKPIAAKIKAQRESKAVTKSYVDCSEVLTEESE